MQSRYPEAVKTIDWADPKFEARVEITSIAAQQLREDAEGLVDTYLSHAELAFEDSNPYTVGAVFVRPDATHKFTNAIHDGYSDLNAPELAVAHEIDGTGLTWARNPVNGGYSIPLLDKGESRRFFPDFLVWKDKHIIAVDPKGGFLLQTEAGRKLLAIRDEKGQQRILVRFITVGTWSAETMKQTNNSGYSDWRMTTPGQIRCTNHGDLAGAVKKALELK
jgi:type III restriction enzyme